LIGFVSGEFATLESSNNNALNNLKDTSCTGTGVTFEIAKIYCQDRFCTRYIKAKALKCLNAWNIEYDRYAGYIS